MNKPRVTVNFSPCPFDFASIDLTKGYNLMFLYVYDHYNGNRGDTPNTEQLISYAAKQYLFDTGLALDLEPVLASLKRSRKGKPYFEGSPVHCSVSHSENIWVCLMGSRTVGVDVQKNRQNNYQAIAKRFFQPEEQTVVESDGLLAFIGLWCRKEAFIKYHGYTIGDTIDWLNVAHDGNPAPQVTYNDQTVYFTELDVHQDFTCVAANDVKERIWIRKLEVK